MTPIRNRGSKQRQVRAAIYSRVSTRGTSKYGDKTAFDQNPEVQEAPLREFIRSRGWTLEKVYSDRESGRSMTGTP
jgi:DNA invertase Pin-like site-specific DNA recombinase